MATSETIGQTTVDVATMIETSFRKCGKLPSTISGELLEAARLNLYLILVALANDGVNLWCINKSVVNVAAEAISYPLSSNMNRVIRVLYRTLGTMTTTSTNADTDYKGVVLSTATAVTNVSGQFTAAGVATLVAEYSLDGVTWVIVAGLGAFNATVNSTFTLDIDNTASATRWRIRDSSGTLVAMTNVQFRTITDELPLAALNRDDYQQLPNKRTPGQKALQFWFDKQVIPKIWVWPLSNRTQDQLVIWEQGTIEDVGALTNTLAVPDRWIKSIIYSLAVESAMDLPGNELPAGRLAELKGFRLEHSQAAANGESDGSSYKLAPRISGYTR